MSGTIPRCLSNFTAMTKKGSLTITYNFSIDNPIGHWEIGREFEYKNTLGLVKSIDFSSNKLTGEIPKEVTDLLELVSLNFSRNNLTGLIPTTIGQLKSLDVLDLSQNQLIGEIPSSLSEIDRLSTLDLSNNNLSGKIPRGTQLQSFNASAYEGNPTLCGLPLLKKCPEDRAKELPMLLAMKTTFNKMEMTCGFMLALLLDSLLDFGECVGIYGYTAYTTSKFSLMGLTKALQQEAIVDNIYVSLIFPLETETPGIEAREMKFGWQIDDCSIIGFFGATFGSASGVGGGGSFVTILKLGSTVYYNLKLRHSTLDMPIIDYDLTLLFQPMLMMGISIRVVFNVVFADSMVTILLIVLFLGTSTKAFLKGVETWKKETIMKKVIIKFAAKRLGTNGNGMEEVEYKPLPSGLTKGLGKRFTSSELKFAITRDFSLEMVIGEDFGSTLVYNGAQEVISIRRNVDQRRSTLYHHMPVRHPTLDMPIIYYDLALLFQPMLMMGISIGFAGTSTKAFLKGVETWKKETIMKKEAAKRLGTNDNGTEEVEYKPLPSGLSNGTQNATKKFEELEVSIL
ncbi:hypothetical protein AAG906_004599 [Vitis piasezkii]